MSYVSSCKRCVQRKSAVSFSSYNLSPQYSYGISGMNSASGRYNMRRKRMKNGESSSNGVRKTVIGKKRKNSSARTSKAFQNIKKWKMNRARDFLASLEENLTKTANKKAQINEFIKLLEGAQGQFRAYSDASIRAVLKNSGKLNCFSLIILYIISW